jgi:RNA polymerase sigma-70 factor (ECF subfamily)
MVKAKLASTSAGAAASDAAFAKYAAALRGYLLRRVRRPAEAADLAQETFARFLRKRDRPEVIRQPLAFLFGIAANVIREQVEAQRAGLVEFDSERAEAAAASANAEVTNSAEEQVGLRDDLASALKTLPPNHLAAVLLIKGEGLSIAEAARRTGLSEGTLSVYLCEARWKLRRILQADYARSREQT